MDVVVDIDGDGDLNVAASVDAGCTRGASTFASQVHVAVAVNVHDHVHDQVYVHVYVPTPCPTLGISGYPDPVKHAWLGLMLVCACAQDEVGAVDEFTIEGTVQDDFTSRGVSGAKVEFVSDTLDRAETITESDGRFTLHVELADGVEFGTLEASRSGYTNSPKASVYFDGSAPRAELRMRPND
jgi:hypothetical protein